jgi:polar amino acid transport system substrate-binding protein
MLKRTVVTALAGLAILAAPMAAAEARTLDEILSEGVLRVGINPNFPNMSTRNADGEWEGFDIDIATALADGLGVEVEWVPTETPQRVPFLVSPTVSTYRWAR